MEIKSFFDADTATITYLVIDDKTQNCAIIDSVLNYDPQSGRTSTKSADELIDYIKSRQLQLQLILETHIHADHLTAASYIKEKLGGKIAVSASIKEVIVFWARFFNINDQATISASYFDLFLQDKEEFEIGSLKAKIIYTHGHTPACTSFIIEDAVFVGDLLLMPEIGTGRTDFPGGNPREMYHSIQKIFALPDNFRVFTAHDYPEQGKEVKFQSTIAQQKNSNILAKIKDEEEYVKIRSGRDQNKPVPKLLLPSIQVNIRAGKLPEAENNGVSYIKIPLNSI